MLSAINALSHPIISSVSQFGGAIAVLNLFGFSAVIAFAILALERISASEGAFEENHSLDMPIFAMSLVAAFLPVAQLSGITVFGLGLWLQFSSAPSSRSRRIGVVLLALSGPLLWGQLALSLFSEQILSWDARMVGALAHSPVDGNIVRFIGRDKAFYIAPPCSSLSHLTLATLLWASITQLLGRRVDRNSLLLCIAATLSVVVVNVLRLTAIAAYPNDFFVLHDGWLAQLFGWVALAMAGGIVAIGTARATRS